MLLQRNSTKNHKRFIKFARAASSHQFDINLEMKSGN